MRVLVICAVVLVIFCFLVPSAWLIFRRLPEDIGHEIDSRLSDQTVVEEADKDLSKQERELRKKYTVVYVAKERADELQSQIVTDRAQLAKEEEILKRSRELLKQNQPGSTIVVGGANHAWETLQEDAGNHLLYCQTLKAKIQSDEKSHKDYQQAYDHGNQVIDKELARIQRERIQVDLDKIKLAAGRAKQQVRALDDEIRGITVSSSSSARYHKVLKDRIREINAEDEFDRRIDSGSESKIAWDKELGTSKTAVDAINAYFGDNKPASAPAHR